VHGEYDSLVALLRGVQLIDDQQRWCGNTSMLVQLGDLVDRGPRAKQVMDLMIRLQGEAAAANGSVVVLWGNHELMQLFGDFRYVHPLELLPYAALESSDEYNAGIESVFTFLQQDVPQLPLYGSYYSALRRSYAHHGSVSVTALRRHFKRGFFAHNRLWHPLNVYGQWLLDVARHPLMAKVGTTLMVHAGLHERFTFHDIGVLNQQFATSVRIALALLEECVNLGYCHRAFGVDSMVRAVQYEQATRDGDLSHLTAPVRELFEAVTRLTAQSIIFASDSPVWYERTVSSCARIL